MYLFGSVLRDGPSADVDILVIYEDGDLEAAHRLASDLRAVAWCPPFDVTAMSRSEERQTRFVETVGARPMSR